jgi:formylglycine-generating enzyme required for sulfatase activity
MSFNQIFISKGAGMKKFCLSLMMLVMCLGSTALATNYSIYEGTATIDGNLGEWADATWIDLATTLDGTGIDLSNAKYAVRWSPATNLIYVAVTCTDASHTFIDPTANVGVWNTTDTVEVYVDAAKLNKVNYGYLTDGAQGYWKYAQQYCGGLKTDGSVWCAIAGQDGYDDGTTIYDTNAISTGVISFAASVDGDTINYEMAIKPYKFFQLGDPSTSSTVTLSGGDVIGFDVDVTSYDVNAGAYVVMAENATTNKYYLAANFTSYTLVGTDKNNTDPQFVKIGNANNAADPLATLYGYDRRNYGAVDHEFYISKYELTVAQYCKFLNEAASASDAHTLYSTNMATAAQIVKTTNPDSTFTYTVSAGCANRPIGYLTWAMAARYCNYMTTGNTETGVYMFKADGTYGGCFRTYNPPTTTDGLYRALITGSSPAYWIPNADEYYKAAYYDAATQTYYIYPTSSNNIPNAGDFDGTNSGNWREGNVAVLGSPFNFTEVGTFENTKSPYGCYDMVGNVWEWTENFLWGAWVSGVHTYGPTYHGGSWYSNTYLYCNVDYFSGYVAAGTSSNAYGVNIANGDMGVRICCNQPAIDELTRVPGDANGDKMVDVGDLGILAANYGATSGATWAMGDFNGDGAVDVGDLGILAANYGTGTSGADFDADYAKVFGTDATDTTDTTEATTDDTTEEGSTSICSSLGLSLVVGLVLMGLMMVKLEE